MPPKRKSSKGPRAAPAKPAAAAARAPSASSRVSAHVNKKRKSATSTASTASAVTEGHERSAASPVAEPASSPSDTFDPAALRSVADPVLPAEYTQNGDAEASILGQPSPVSALHLLVARPPAGQRRRAPTMSPEDVHSLRCASPSVTYPDVPSSLYLPPPPASFTSRKATRDQIVPRTKPGPQKASPPAEHAREDAAALDDSHDGTHRSASVPFSPDADEVVFFGGPAMLGATGQSSTTTRQRMARNENRYHSFTNSERGSSMPSECLSQNGSATRGSSYTRSSSSEHTPGSKPASRRSTLNAISPVSDATGAVLQLPSAIHADRYGSVPVSDVMLSLQQLDEEEEEEAAVASLAAIVHELRREGSMSMFSAPRVQHLPRRPSIPHSQPESAVTRYLRLDEEGPKPTPSPVFPCTPTLAEAQDEEENGGSAEGRPLVKTRPGTSAPPLAPTSCLRVGSVSAFVDSSALGAGEDGAVQTDSALDVDLGALSMPSVLSRPSTAAAPTTSGTPPTRAGSPSTVAAVTDSAFIGVPSPPSTGTPPRQVSPNVSRTASGLGNSPSTPRRVPPARVHTVPASPSRYPAGAVEERERGTSPGSSALPAALLRVPSPPLIASPVLTPTNGAVASAASSDSGERSPTGSGEAISVPATAPLTTLATTTSSSRSGSSLPDPLSIRTSTCSSIPLSPPFVDQSPSLSHLPQQRQATGTTTATTATAATTAARRGLDTDTVHHTIAPGWHPHGGDADGTEASGDAIGVVTDSEKLCLGSFLEKQQSFSIIRGTSAPPLPPLSPVAHVPAPPSPAPQRDRVGETLSHAPQQEDLQPRRRAAAGRSPEVPLHVQPPWAELASTSLIPSAPITLTSPMEGVAPLPMPPPPPTQYALSVPSLVVDVAEASETAATGEDTAESPFGVGATRAGEGLLDPRHGDDTSDRPALSLAQPSVTAGHSDSDSDSLPVLSRSSSVSFVANREDDEETGVHVPAVEIVAPRTASLLVVRPREGRMSPAAENTGTDVLARELTEPAAAPTQARPKAAPAASTAASTEPSNAVTSKRAARQQALAESFRSRIQVGVKASHARKSGVRRSKNTDNSRGGSASGRPSGGSSGGRRPSSSSSSSSSRRRGGSATRRRSTSVHGRPSGSLVGRGPVTPHTHFVSVAIIGFFLSRLLAVVARVRREAYLEQVGRPRAAYIVQCAWRAYKQRERVRRAEAVQLLVPWLRHKLKRLRRAKEASARLLQRVFRGQRDRSFHHFLYEQMQYNRALSAVRRRVGMWESRNLLQRLRDERDERNILIQQCEQGTVRVLREQRQEWADLMREAHTMLNIVHNFTVAEWAAMVEQRTGFNPLMAEDDDEEGESSTNDDNSNNNNNHSGESTLVSRERTPIPEGATPPSSWLRTRVDLMVAAEATKTMPTSPTSAAPLEGGRAGRHDEATRQPADVRHRYEEEDDDVSPSTPVPSIQASSPRSPALVTVVPPRDDAGSAVCHARRKRRTASATPQPADNNSSAGGVGVGVSEEGGSGTQKRQARGASARNKAILSFSGAAGVVAGLIVSRTRLGQPETAVYFLNETFQRESARYLDDLFPYALLRQRGLNGSVSASHSLMHGAYNYHTLSNSPLSARQLATPSGGEDVQQAASTRTCSEDRCVSPFTQHVLEPAARQDPLYCAFVNLLESTEATTRQVLQQNLLDQHRSFLLPISVVNRVVAMHGTVPPLYAGLLVSMKDEEFTARAAALFRAEQKARLAIIAEYEVVPLEALNRPLLSGEAETRRQRLAYLSHHSMVPLAAYEAEENTFLRKVLKLEQRRQLVSGGATHNHNSIHYPNAGHTPVGQGGAVGDGSASFIPLDSDTYTHQLSLGADDDDLDDDEQQRTFKPIASLKPVMQAAAPQAPSPPSQRSRVQRRFKVFMSSAQPSVVTTDDTVMMESTYLHGLERHDSVLTALTEEVAASERRRPRGAPMPMLRAEPSLASARSFSGGTTNWTPSLGGAAEGLVSASTPRPTPITDGHSLQTPLSPPAGAVAARRGLGRGHAVRARHDPPVPQVQLTAEQIDECEDETGGNYAQFRENSPRHNDDNDDVDDDVVAAADDDHNNNNNNNTEALRVRPGSSEHDAVLAPSLSDNSIVCHEDEQRLIAHAAARRATLPPLVVRRPSAATAPGDASLAPASASAGPDVQPPTLRALRQLGLARRTSPFELLEVAGARAEDEDETGGEFGHVGETTIAAGRAGLAPWPPRSSPAGRQSSDDRKDEAELFATVPTLHVIPPSSRLPQVRSSVVSGHAATAVAVPSVSAPGYRPYAPPPPPRPPVRPRASDASTVVPPQPRHADWPLTIDTPVSAPDDVTSGWSLAPHSNCRLSVITDTTSLEDGDASSEGLAIASSSAMARASTTTTVVPRVRTASSTQLVTTVCASRAASEAPAGVDHMSLFDSANNSSRDSSVFEDDGFVPPPEGRHGGSSRGGAVFDKVSSRWQPGVPFSAVRHHEGRSGPQAVRTSSVVETHRPPTPPPRRVHTAGQA